MRALGILAIAVRILWLGSSSLLDDSSFLAKYFSVDRLLNRAALTSYSKDCEIAYSLQPSYESAKKIAKSYEMSGRFQDALSWYEKVQQFKPSDIDSLLFLGLMHHFSGEYASAMEYYNRILEQQADHADAWFHMGVSSQYTGDIQRAAFCYTKSVESDPMHMKSRLNLASMHHQYGSIDDALPHYQLALEQYKGMDLLSSPEYSMVKLNYGVALLQQGRHEEAKDNLQELISEMHFALNVGDCSRYFQREADVTASSARGHVRREAETEEQRETDEAVDETSAQRLRLLKNACDDWSRTIDVATSHIINVQRSSCDWHLLEERYSELLQKALQYASRSQKAEFLLPFDTLMTQISLRDRLAIAQSYADSIPVHKIKQQPSQSHETPATLSAVPNANVRAGGAGAGLQESNPSINESPPITSRKKRRKLKLGFISYDFNDHPTAHLVEGIFHVVHRLRCHEQRNAGSHPDYVPLATATGSETEHKMVPGTNTDQGYHDTSAAADRGNMRRVFDGVEVVAYSYGRDDNSTYRHQLIQNADRFVDLAALPHAEAAQVIRDDDIDILLDMQVHTLGNRLQIISGRPASVQVNYLVYPGTSGAHFLDTIVTDRIVTPAEHAQYYSEGLLLLPPTYQISFFDRHVPTSAESSSESSSIYKSWSQRQALRRKYGLPSQEEDVIFCNFNKIDKIDHLSFSVWMAIMSRVPRSYLWLLKPSRSRGKDDTFDTVKYNALVESNLRTAAAAAGVHPKRIIFAERENKSKHILRQAAADLFLDTLVYGAHSTATDAIRGGLPVVSVEGDSFPSRVPASLYASMPCFCVGCLNETSSKQQIHPVREEHEDFLCDDAGQSLPNRDSSTNVAAKIRNVAHAGLLLIYGSTKEFEDTVVSLAISQKSVLEYVRKYIAKVVDSRSGLFDTEKGVLSFVHGMQALHEVRQARKGSCEKNFSIKYDDSGSGLHDEPPCRFDHIIVSSGGT